MMTDPTATVSDVAVTRPADPDDDNAKLLYREVPQIVGDNPMRSSFVTVTPEQARQWLLHAAEDTTFKQRHTSPRDIRRWKILMDTERFVHFLPDGPLCFDDNGVLLNGKHRLTAVVQHNKPVGFLVIKHVPRWMFRFFDTGRGRTLRDVFFIAGMATQAQTGSTMRLAMRYEEVLFGVRPQQGWRDWRIGQRDEHADVEDFIRRRTDLSDWYYVAQQVYNGSKLIIASATVFRFYQALAWPEGEEKIVEFCEGLAKGAMLAPRHPTLVLREWARKGFVEKEKIEAKREVHLLLLFRHFTMFANSERTDRVMYARGFPMPLPYHPEGSDVAVKNVLAALREMDEGVDGTV
jgi:hypothetical protein